MSEYRLSGWTHHFYKRSVNAQRVWTFYIPDGRWNSKIVWKRSWSPRIDCKAVTTCKEWRSQRRTARKLGGTKHRITQKPAMTSGRFKLTSLIALIVNREFNCRKKKHSNSSEVHWRDQDYARKSVCVAGKPYWRPLECRCGSKFGRFVDSVPEIHVIEWETSQRKKVVRGAVYKDSRAQKRRSRNGLLKNQSSITLEKEEAFISSIRKMESIRKPVQKQGKSWKFRWRQCGVNWERGFGESFKGPLKFFGATVEYHPISPRNFSRIHQFAKKVLLGIFLGSELIAGWIWQGYILIANLEDFEKLDASDVYPRRINAKEVLISQKDGEFVFPVADGTAKLSGRDFEFRVPTHSKAGTNRKERSFQQRTSWWIGRVSTDGIHRWHSSPCRLLVDPRWPHLS